jgi:hypothetical protein
MGGLGNQLFQMAFLDYISQNTGYTACIERIDYTVVHSPILYFNCIFQNWKHLFGTMSPITQEVHENNMIPKDWISLTRQRMNVRFVGYFQHYKYITASFISKLIFDESILTKYPDIHKKVFIHIRGGDFLRYPHNLQHNIDLANYYKKAIEIFPHGTEFVVFTNDNHYTTSLEWLKSVNYTIILQNEIDSLFLMSKCLGGICANSTFSWWGAYLNSNRKLILPSKIINNINTYTLGLYFPQAIIIEV